jgi:hypothetical protein
VKSVLWRVNFCGNGGEESHTFHTSRTFEVHAVKCAIVRGECRSEWSWCLFDVFWRRNCEFPMSSNSSRLGVSNIRNVSVVTMPSFAFVLMTQFVGSSPL